MPNAKLSAHPTASAIGEARVTAGLSQSQAAPTMRASPRTWLHGEADDRAMPAGLFELFMHESLFTRSRHPALRCPRVAARRTGVGNPAGRGIPNMAKCLYVAPGIGTTH